MNKPLINYRPAEILLVEDNESDVLLMREGFKRAKLSIHLHHVENGLECMDFLRKRGPYAEAPTPDLILLDLNMPIMDGREVLEEMLADEKLRHLPVVVLTTSANDIDILQVYGLGGNSYIVKPVDFEQFQRIIQGISDYWFTIVVLPTPESL